MEVGADDAEYFGELKVADAMEDHEQVKQEDAGQFDEGAPGQPVVQIIEKIEAVAADGQHDKRIQLPEFVLWSAGRSGYRMVFHLFVRGGNWIYPLNIEQISGLCKGAGYFLGTFNNGRISTSKRYGQMDHGGRCVGVVHGFYRCYGAECRIAVVAACAAG